MVVCNYCNKPKSLNEYYTSCLTKCKGCFKAYYLVNKENIIKRQRLWRKNNWGLKRAQKQRYYAKNKHKVAAHEAIRRARVKGVLVIPNSCSRCKKVSIDMHAHHYKGYDKQYWLVVSWLCRKCHAVIHNGKN